MYINKEFRKRTRARKYAIIEPVGIFQRVCYQGLGYTAFEAKKGTKISKEKKRKREKGIENDKQNREGETGKSTIMANQLVDEGILHFRETILSHCIRCLVGFLTANENCRGDDKMKSSFPFATSKSHIFNLQNALCTFI